MAFFNRKLHHTDQTYSASNRELLAAFLAIIHFRYFLPSSFLHGVHRPQAVDFCRFQSKRSVVPETTETSEFTTDVRRIVGKSNTVSYALSRAAVSTVCSPHSVVIYIVMTAAQPADEGSTSTRTASTDLVIFVVMSLPDDPGPLFPTPGS